MIDMVDYANEVLQIAAMFQRRGIPALDEKRDKPEKQDKEKEEA